VTRAAATCVSRPHCPREAPGQRHSHRPRRRPAAQDRGQGGSCGRGVFRAEIEPLLKQPGIEYIGEIDERRKPAFLGEARALLFPSMRSPSASSSPRTIAPERQYRRSGAGSLRVIDDGRRLRPIDGKQQGARLAEKGRLAALVDLADVLDAGLLQQRLDLGAEILHVHTIHLGRDLERQAGGAGDGYGAVQALLGAMRPRNAR